MITKHSQSVPLTKLQMLKDRTKLSPLMVKLSKRPSVRWLLTSIVVFLPIKAIRLLCKHHTNQRNTTKHFNLLPVPTCIRRDRTGLPYWVILESSWLPSSSQNNKKTEIYVFTGDLRHEELPNGKKSDFCSPVIKAASTLSKFVDRVPTWDEAGHHVAKG